MDQTNINLTSTYPSAPLIYINNYTNENVKLGQVQPPPPIIKDSYSCFGKQIAPDDVLIKPLEEYNMKCLYKSNGNYKYELKKLNHSILMNYLDLLEILTKAPNKIGPSGRTLQQEKLEDLTILFSNMHHLINKLRPRQARENLITILEMQKEQRLEIANKFHKHLIIIMDLLKQSIDKIKVNNDELNSLLNDFNVLIENNKNYLNNQKINFEPLSKNKQLYYNDQNINSNNNNIIENDITQNIFKSTNKLLNNNQQQNKIEEEKNNYEYKDRVLCDIIDNFLSNKIEL